MQVLAFAYSTLIPDEVVASMPIAAIIAQTHHVTPANVITAVYVKLYEVEHVVTV